MILHLGDWVKEFNEIGLTPRGRLCYFAAHARTGVEEDLEEGPYGS